jgi:DNA-binding transcriptional ArsR family regulator
MPPARARPPAARFAGGTAFELLASLAAVAEPRWRSVLTDGEQLIGLARRERGPAWVRQVASAGRFGWINLMSLVLEGARPHTAERSLARLAATDAELFHLAALGMRRRQLRALVSHDQAVAAIGGDRSARQAVRRAAGSDQMVISVSRWLLSNSSEHVQRTMLDLLTQWHATVAPGWAASRLSSALDREVAAQRKRLGATGAVDVIRAVSGGLVYAPATGSRTTVLAPAPSVDPAVIVVDGVDCDLIVYSPLAAAAPTSRDRLLLMSRALGDDIRLQLLALLREGQQTATGLAGRLDMPRTTLIHHLALLRSAGLIRTEVLGNATYYTLLADAPEAMSRALHDFFATPRHT